MSTSRVTRYVEKTIARYTEVSGLKPDPIYPGWTNFVSQRSVRAIAVASKSPYIWIATWGGVIAWKRKDDRVYQRYSSEHGLAGNAVSCLCLDKAENPWVGHSEGGLSYFNGQRWQIYAYLGTEPIRKITAVPSGGVWAAGTQMVYYIPSFNDPPQPLAINSEVDKNNVTVDTVALLATSDHLFIGNPWGLFRTSIDQAPTQIAPSVIQSCTALAQDQKGQIWVGTPEGVYWLENDFPMNSWVGIEGAADRVVELAVSGKRTWVLNVNGLFQIVDGRWSPVPLPEAQSQSTIRSIAASASESYLWVGTDRLLAGVQILNLGTSRWDLDQLPTHPEDNLSNFGRCVSSKPDSSEVLVGMSGGIFVYESQQKWKFSDSCGNVHAICNHATTGKSWILSLPDGVFQLLDVNQLKRYGLQPQGFPTALSIGQDDLPYVLTEQGLWRLHYQENKKTKVAFGKQPCSRCIAQSSDGMWWAGTPEGLYKLVNGQWQFVGEQPGPLHTRIHAFIVKQNALWVATETGLWILKGNQWEQHIPTLSDPSLQDGQEGQFTLETLKQHAVFWAITSSRRSESFWLASKVGIIRYDPSTRKVTQHFNRMNSGLASHRVTALVESSDALWVVTQFGISRVALD